MKVLSWIAGAFGSLLVGGLAALWLVVLTPPPTALSASPETAAAVRSPAAVIEPALQPIAVATTETVPSPQPAPPAAASPRLAVSHAPQPMPGGNRPHSASMAPVRVMLPSRSGRSAKASYPIRDAAKHQPIEAAPPARIESRSSEGRGSEGRVGSHRGYRVAGTLTPAEIGRIRSALRLSPDQAALWPPVAEVLRALGQRQMAALRSGGEASLGSTSDLMRFYAVAQPLLRGLREDQKIEVRALASRMGFGSFASYI